MKLCTRCAYFKPDANFAKNGQYGGKAYAWCFQCRSRTYNDVIPKGVQASFQVSPIPASPDDIARIKLARLERARFIQRGAPIVERLYTKTPSGVLVKSRSRT